MPAYASKRPLRSYFVAKEALHKKDIRFPMENGGGVNPIGLGTAREELVSTQPLRPHVGFIK